MLEVLIVMGILSIVLGSSLAISGNTDLVSQRQDVRDQVKSHIYTAQIRARAGVNSTSHGVYIAPHAITVFQGGSYATRDTDYDLVTTFPDAVTLTAEESEVIFSYGRGLPSATTTLVISHAISGRHDLYINEHGAVEHND